MATSSDDAQRILGNGAYVDALFSPDSSKLYAVSNGAGGSVTVFDVASGATLASYAFGQSLGGADLSPDGAKLLVADQSTYSATDGHARFFELDLNTGAVSTFTDTGSQYGGFTDVSFLTDTTALVALGGSARSATVRYYDLATGTFTADGGLQSPTLTPSADHSHVFATFADSNRHAAVYLADGSVAGSAVGVPGSTNYTLYPGLQAISSDGSLVAVADFTSQGELVLATGSFGALTSPSAATPYLDDVAPLAFSADGKTLYEGLANLVVAIDLASGQAIGGYALTGGGAAIMDRNGYPIGYGDNITASADGHYLSVIEGNGVEIIDLTQATFASGPGDDVLNGFQLYGFAGDDTLIDPNTDGHVGSIAGRLFGGPGDDTYYINGQTTQITEYAGQGIDTVYSSTSGYVPLNVENYVLTGTGANGITAYGAYGNDLDNRITGTALSDRIDGYAGDDTLIGNAGNDDLRGGDGNDALFAGAGNDSLDGSAGDDVLDVGGGDNVVNGGDGNDTLVLAGARASYTVLTGGGHTYLVGPDGAAQVANVEQVRFADATVSFADAVAGAQPFDALRYIASYPDLVRAFGADAQAGAQHYIDHGFAEGRTAFASGFDGREYLASNPDLARTFGDNASFGAWHYLNYGFTEGRPTATFDAREYLASNPDLARIFGDNADAGLTHFLYYGANEGRPTASFDAREYLASNPDLARIFGDNAAAGTTHYLDYGANESRPTATFDPQQYLAANTDLLRAFGNDAAAATTHYLNYGADEGRAVGGFDAVAYLLSNPDLQSAGYGASGAFNHWLVYGAEEGRAGDASFGREQASHALTPGATTSQAIDQAGDHDWFELDLSAGQHAHVDLSAAFGETVTLHDAAGHLLAGTSSGDGHLGLDVTAAAAGAYYLTVEAADATAHGAYAITAMVG